jgi:predicted secreted protein
MAKSTHPVSGFAGNVMVSPNSQGASFINLGYAKNQTITINAEPLDSTNYQSRGWMVHTVGLRSWEVTVESLYVDADEGLSLIRQTLLNPLAPNSFPPRALYWAFFPIDQGVARLGTTYYTGNGMVSSFEMDDPVDDLITVSMTITGNGQLNSLDTTVHSPAYQVPHVTPVQGL